MSYPTKAESIIEPYARVASHRIIGGPREGLPEWWSSLLLGEDRHRLDIALDGAFRTGIVVDGVTAIDHKHDIIRLPDGRFFIVESDNVPPRVLALLDEMAVNKENPFDWIKFHGTGKHHLILPTRSKNLFALCGRLGVATGSLSSLDNTSVLTNSQPSNRTQFLDEATVLTNSQALNRARLLCKNCLRSYRECISIGTYYMEIP